MSITRAIHAFEQQWGFRPTSIEVSAKIYGRLEDELKGLVPGTLLTTHDGAKYTIEKMTLYVAGVVVKEAQQQ